MGQAVTDERRGCRDLCKLNAPARAAGVLCKQRKGWGSVQVERTCKVSGTGNGREQTVTDKQACNILV